MQKIRNIRNIEHEKMRLRVKQLELEKDIAVTWKDLKTSFANQKNNTEKDEKFFQNKEEVGVVLTTLIDYGSGFFSRFLSQKAGEKLESTLQKGAYKLARNIKARFGKNK